MYWDKIKYNEYAKEAKKATTTIGKYQQQIVDAPISDKKH